MVRLVPMGDDEYAPFMEELLRSYAESHVRSGRWTAAEGPAKAREEVAHLLTSGRATPDHWFFSVLAEPEGTKVGALWLAVEPRGAFVYDLEIDEPYRRRGHAEAAMRAAEEVARTRGAGKISLHVFGDNTGARQLYRKLGYEETNVMMAKSLAP